MHTSSLSTSLLALSLTLNLSFALAHPSTYDSDPCPPTLISFLAPRYMSVLGIRRQLCLQTTAHDRQNHRDEAENAAQPSLFRRSVELASDYLEYLPSIPLDQPRLDEGELHGRDIALPLQELQEEHGQEAGRKTKMQRRTVSATEQQEKDKRRLEGRPHNPTVQGAEQEGTQEPFDDDTESYIRTIINSVETIPHARLPTLPNFKLPTIDVPPTGAPSTELLHDIHREAEDYQNDEPIAGLSISQPFTRPQVHDSHSRLCRGKLDIARLTSHTWHSISHSVTATINGIDENIAAVAAIAVGIVVLLLLAVETLLAGRRGAFGVSTGDEEKSSAETGTRGRTMARRQRGRAWWMYTHR